MTKNRLIEQLIFLKNNDCWKDRPKLWKSNRYSRFFLFNRPDNNIFVSTSIIYLLRQIQFKLDTEDQKKIKILIDDLGLQYEFYRNKDARLSYNFWKTKPSEHFPNGLFLRHFDYFRLPDDSDDSALIALSANFSKKKVEKVICLFSSFANLQNHRIKRTKDKYQNYRAFTTFLAKQTPLEFDICVQTNILSLFYKHHIKLNSVAEQTVLYLKHVIKDRLILKNSFLASPNYYRTAIILYHIARLIYFYNCHCFDHLITELIYQAKSQKIKDKYDLFFQQFTLLLLKQNCSFVEFNPREKFPFFIAGMLSGFESKWIQALAPYPLFHIKYHSEALNIAFLLQFKILYEEKYAKA